jgi:peptidyl-prolyl cis-trans isomerase B (cyclophilin B)
MMKRGLVLAILVIAICITCVGCKQNDPYADMPNPIATITMQDGSTMVFELYLREVPNTVANFTELANKGFYDNMPVYFIAPGGLIYSGDPKGDGSGDPGYAIKGEFKQNGHTNNISHVRGVISMARRDDNNSAGSIFFILHGSYPDDYDGKYAAFGKIMDEPSYDTLDEICETPVDVRYNPLRDVRIATIRVDTKGNEFEVKKIERDK